MNRSARVDVRAGMISPTAIAALAALVALVAVPLVLRPRIPAAATAVVHLVIITPHDQNTREEFARAFSAYYLETRQIAVQVDWLSPGGTNDITRYLDGRYSAAFDRLAGAEFHQDVVGFNVPKLDATDPKLAGQRAAHAKFLASDIGCDIDIFWGGGELPHRQQADKGYLVDAGLQKLEPGWFKPDVIPQTLSGSTIYDPKGRYYGACLSSFGIGYNPDRIAALDPPTPPTQWADLGDPRFLGSITMVDPTRSGAVVTAFEQVIQQRMALAVAAYPNGSTVANPAALAEGWREAFVLFRRMAGNARAVTDGASYAAREVARGDAAAAICIDFHARAEGGWTAHDGGPERVVYVAPPGGTSISADPISLLRGAPHHDLAVDFMHFVLSPEGQRLWDYRPGESGGPKVWALRRMAVRRDVYTPADRSHMSDPDSDPFALAAGFTYHPSWTGPLYPLIGPLSKAILLDPRDELVTAWKAIIAAGGPEKVPEAWAAFCWLPVPYDQAAAARDEVRKPPEISLPLLRSWTVGAQEHYRLAAQLAAEGR
jgi:ABC-type Fe3+ transport system substrate-binding protein